MCTLIRGSCYEERLRRLLALTRKLAGDGGIGVDEAASRSEKSHGNKNRALAYLLKSHGLLEEDVEEVLDRYFRACSIQVDCRALAHIGAALANRGRLPVTNERIFPAAMSRYVNAILMTCGMYDGSGEFALRVGVPAKSGVGGGARSYGRRRLWPRAGPKGEQCGGHSAFGAIEFRTVSEHFLKKRRADLQKSQIRAALL